MRSPEKAVRALIVLAVLGVLTGGAPARAQGSRTAPADARETKNPVTGVGNAVRTIQAQCATCHGASGKGDGPVAAGLPVKPADWSSPRVQEQTDGELYWKISTGRGVMPPWKHLPERDRWEVVNYIRSLKR